MAALQGVRQRKPLTQNGRGIPTPSAIPQNRKLLKHVLEQVFDVALLADPANTLVISCQAWLLGKVAPITARLVLGELKS
jgi:hypothetical protein